MAQTGYTPIKIYASSTASAVPLAANLDNTNGAELAINIADGKLFYKDSGGTVKVIAGTGGTGVVAGSNTQIQFNNNGVFGASSSLTWSGTKLTTQDLALTGNVTSNLLFSADNTYDIGASGATRPRNLYLAGNEVVAGSVTWSGGTANGVAYLNGSKVATTGSSLTFDGTNFAVGGSGMTNIIGAKGGYMEVYQASNSVSSGYGYRFYSDGGATHSLLAYINGLQETLGSSAGSVIIGTNNGTSAADKVWIKSTGLVGIGTANPITLLHTYVASGANQLTVQSGSSYTYFGTDGSYMTIASNIGATGKKFLIDPSTPDSSLVVNNGGIFGFRQAPSLASGPIVRIQSDGTYNAGVGLYNNAGTAAGSFKIENPTTSTDLGLYSTGYLRVYTAGDATNTTLVANNLTLAIGVSSNAAITYNSTTFTPYLRVGNAAAGKGGLAINAAGNTDCPFLWVGTGANATTQVAVMDDNANLILGVSSFAQRLTATSSGLYVQSKIGVGTTTLDGLLSLGGATTGNIYQTTKNTGGSLLMGVESSAGGTIVSGGSAYAAVINQQNNYPLQLGANNTVMLSLNKDANYIDAATNVIIRTNTGGYFYGYGRYGNTNNYGTILFVNGTGYNMCLAEVANSNWALGAYVSGSPSTNIMDVKPIRWNASGYVALGNYYSDALNTSSGAPVACYSGYASGTNATVASICRGGAYTSAYISASNPGFDWQFGKAAQTGTSADFEWGQNGGGGTVLMKLSTGGNLTVYGSLSKGSGSFVIDHPLPEKEETHYLVHSFIEGPQADLIYRGRVNLVNGRAEVNIDTASDMTDGTLMALCRDLQCFTTNESDWFHVRGSINGNILTIESQEPTATSSISWMVIGERKDKHMLETDWTDENGKIIVEPTKASREYDPANDALNPESPVYDLNAATQMKPWLKDEETK